ncbi:TetR/AcrR family transcriptional regulator [Mangrovibacterium lignilyticum]|uniref:TetR/AcrR family transcriptional regulator n=1 Tax=Mangrovibacterium lignilyticum TaxID=2668052 RepID=UPI0013D6878F|nr:TetR/AcrR family transcriptional regulator [Mangrovibacterium lignilyticum]
MVLEKDENAKLEILREAQKLFQQFGLKKTTMDEIAGSCGKAKSTLYHYFKSKEDVFDAVIEMEMTNLRKVVKEKVESQKTVADKLKTYILEFQRESVKKANLYRIVQYKTQHEKRSKILFHRMMEFEKAYILRIMQDAYDAGECPDYCTADLPAVAELLLAGFYGTIQYLIERDDQTDQQKLEKIAEIFTQKLFGKSAG